MPVPNEWYSDWRAALEYWWHSHTSDIGAQGADNTCHMSHFTVRVFCAFQTLLQTLVRLRILGFYIFGKLSSAYIFSILRILSSDSGLYLLKTRLKNICRIFFFQNYGFGLQYNNLHKDMFQFHCKVHRLRIWGGQKISLNCYRLNSTSFLLEALIIVLQYKLRLRYNVLINVNFYLKDCFFFGSDRSPRRGDVVRASGIFCKIAVKISYRSILKSPGGF